MNDRHLQPLGVEIVVKKFLHEYLRHIKTLRGRGLAINSKNRVTPSRVHLYLYGPTETTNLKILYQNKFYSNPCIYPFFFHLSNQFEMVCKDLFFSLCVLFSWHFSILFTVATTSVHDLVSYISINRGRSVLVLTKGRLLSIGNIFKERTGETGKAVGKSKIKLENRQ